MRNLFTHKIKLPFHLMSKLPAKYQFIDLSDYGRFLARRIAKALEHTSVTPMNVTTLFIISGLLAIICILLDYKIAAALLLVLKSVLDAADGELSRIKQMPSFVGRYYDSIADIILNFLFLLAFWYVSDGSLLLMFLAFIGIQLQGTLYNYYYVILRTKVDGDSTSRVFEDSSPIAMNGEDQKTIDRYFSIFNFLYSAFDKTIHWLDKTAIDADPFPKWFMTMVSALGLGSQLLIMSVMLVLDLEHFVIPFFIGYSVLVLVFVGVRKGVLG